MKTYSTLQYCIVSFAIGSSMPILLFIGLLLRAGILAPFFPMGVIAFQMILTILFLPEVRSRFKKILIITLFYLGVVFGFIFGIILLGGAFSYFGFGGWI